MPGRGRVLILDEPTSALSLRESRALLDLVLNLKKSGLAILYISHKLDEVFAIADRLTVLRNGRAVATLDRSEASPDRLIPLMVGRRLEEVFPVPEPPPAAEGPPLLRVHGWTLPSPANPQVNLIEDISFEVRAGEIVGIAGLLGAGRTELVESLFGIGEGNLPGYWRGLHRGRAVPAAFRPEWRCGGVWPWSPRIAAATA